MAMGDLSTYQKQLGAEAASRIPANLAQAQVVRAQAALTGEQAAQFGPTAEAQQAAERASAFTTREQGKTLGPVSAADIAMRNAQAGLTTQQAFATPSEAMLREAQARIGIPAEAIAQMGTGALSQAQAEVAPSLVGLRAAQIGAMPSLESLRQKQGEAASGKTMLTVAQARMYGLTDDQIQNGQALGHIAQEGGTPAPDPNSSVYTPQPQTPESTGAGYTGIAQWAKGTADTQKPSQKASGKGLPAKGSKAGPTDIVPAMLSPGEAVLNKGAAEHVGRGIIEHLNKIGLMRMAATNAGGTGGQPAAQAASRKKVQAAPKKAAPTMRDGGGTDAGRAPLTGADFASQNLPRTNPKELSKKEKTPPGHATGATKISKSRAPQTPTGGDTPVMQLALGGMVPFARFYADGTPDVVGKMEANGGPIGLGGGLLDGKNPFTQGYTTIPLVSETRAEDPIASDGGYGPAPAARAPLPQVIRGGVPGFADGDANIGEDVYSTNTPYKGRDSRGMPRYDNLGSYLNQLASPQAPRAAQAGPGGLLQAQPTDGLGRVAPIAPAAVPPPFASAGFSPGMGMSIAPSLGAMRAAQEASFQPVGSGLGSGAPDANTAAYLAGVRAPGGFSINTGGDPSIRVTAPQGFADGVDEVYSMGSTTNEGARAGAAAMATPQLAKATVKGAGTAGGMPDKKPSGYAKGTTKVKSAKAGKSTKSMPAVPMASPPGLTMPAMPSMPMASMPQQPML